MKKALFIMFWKSLRARITLLVLLTIVGGVIAGTSLMGHFATAHVQRLLSDQQQATARFMARNLDEELRLRLDALEKYAGISADAFASGPAAMNDLLQGRAFLNVLFNGGVVALDMDGTALADSSPLSPRIGTSYRDVDSVAAALHDGKTSIGRPIIGKKLRAPIITMAVPVRDRAGRIVGALAGITNLSAPNFLDTLTNGDYDGRGGYVLLVAPRERLIITSSDKRRIMETLPAPGVNPGIDRYLAGAEGTSIVTSPAGQDVLAAVKRIPASDWYLAVLLPTATVFAPVATLYRTTWLATIVIALLVCGLVWLILKRQFAPLRAAASAMGGWAATGRYPMPLPLVRQDEVGELTDGFNHLLHALRLHESALESSERRYRGVVDLVKEVIFQSDAEGRWTFLNPAWTEITGHPVEESLHTFFLDYVHPDDRQANLELFAPLIEGRKDVCRHEVRYLHKEGGFRWLEVYAQLTRDDSGAVIGTTGTLADITERKRAEEQADMLSLVVEQSPECIMITDANRRIEYANAAFYRVTGYSAAEVIGQTPRLLYSGKTPAATYASLYQALREGRAWKGEFCNQRKDGSEYIESASIAPIHDPAGRVIHYVAVQQDITEKKRMGDELEMHRRHLELLVAERTAELATAEQQLRTIIESSADGIIALDVSGRIALVNQTAAEMFGYAPADLVGRNAHETIHYQHPDGTPFPADECGVMHAVLAGRTLRQYAETYWRSDGSPLQVSVATHPIIEGDRVTGAVMTLADATERVRIEAEREQAREDAERLAQLKSSFLANMSHEIRTPLNGILGLAQIGFHDGSGCSKAQRTFGRILDSGKLLLTVINDILDFSKIEAGKLAIESVPVDPAALVEEGAAALSIAAANKNLQLVVEKPSGLPRACLGDPVRISQILLNLVSNAIKFTKQGEVRLGVRREGAELVYRVADTGIGIVPADIERLFKPFEQADGATTRKFGGTGLGLSISQRLAELMGGRLTASSQPGRGSAFELRLPLRETECMTAAPEIPGRNGGDRRLAGLRILVAEDNEINRIVLEGMLQGEGAATVMVENGRLAVEAVARDASAFDLVLTDVQMPEMDGIEATLHLRRIAPALPVLGQTAHAMKEEHDKCLAAGMVATVTKPIDIDLLAGTILRHARNGA